MGSKREVPGGGSAKNGRQEDQVFCKKNLHYSNSQSISLTIWPHISGSDKEDIRTTWEDFCEQLANVLEYPKKELCPLIKLATFGGKRTEKGSLRHDENVIEATGVEGEIDNGKLSIDDARILFEQHNIRAVISTSYNHTPEKPRLHIYAPFSRPLPPDERRRMAARLNGIMGGNLDECSFNLSQSYYTGRKPGAEYRVVCTFDDPEEGYCIDEEEHLDEIAIDPARRTSANSSEHHMNDEHIYKNGFSRGDNNDGHITNDNKHNIHNISLDEGNRDKSLFHIANCLVKGGMTDNNALICLNILAKQCKPTFPENEVSKKFQSAKRRQKNTRRNLTAEVREWVSITWDNISITDAYQNITNITSEDRPKITVIMNRLVKEGVLERVPGRNGIYRRVDTSCETIDFLNAPTTTIPLWLPFQLGEMATIMPGNIIVLAGEPNAGKTAFLLNVTRENIDRFDIHYFSSEMGGAELRERLSKFRDTSLSAWNKVKFKERSGNFGDVIVPGENSVNIIDFLELYDNFYEVAGKLAEIHKKLHGAVAIIALQKNKGADAGLGGERSLEKPRLYLNMGHGFLKIRKCKNFGGTENPNGKRISFKLIDGCKFVADGGWQYDI